MLNRDKPFKGRTRQPSKGSRHRRSLKTRIMFLTAFCVALSTLAIGTLSFVRIRTEAIDLAQARLSSEAHALSQRFALDYYLIAYDLETIAETPPIQGLMRAARNNGIDPQDGSTDALWRERLATIFEAVLKHRTDYFQFRYVGLADSGREIVRVDRKQDTFVTSRVETLQQKDQEPYFRQAAKAPSGRVVFSAVTYNREHGRNESSLTPTLRGMLPIDDPQGNRYGFLVINVDYEKMLRNAFREIDPATHTYVVNGLGDYMEHYSGSRQSPHRLELHSDPTRPAPEIVQRVNATNADEDLFYLEDTVGFFVREAGRFDQAAANLGVAVEIPKSEWYRTSVKTRDEFLAVGLLILLISMVLAITAARSMMQPLSDLADAVDLSGSRETLDFPVSNRNDEISNLALAIQNRDAELTESRERSSAIVNNVVDGLILIDDKGQIEQFNPSCERIFGYSAEEALGRNVSMLMTPEDARPHDGYLERNRKGLGGRSLEITRELKAVDKSGRVFPIELAINAVSVNNEKKFSGVIRDISERREVERLREEFVSTVSHELRTPLTSIRGSLTLLDMMSSDGGLQPKMQKLVSVARKNTERLILLVNDILDFEKLRAGKVHYILARTDITREVKQAIELNQGYADDSHISLNVDLDPEAGLVSLDAEKFQQVMSNLISNAVKFSRSQGTVTVRSRKRDGRVRIEVEDTGTGIPEEFKTQIFEPFSQADGSVTRKNSGTGLGLNLSRNYVEGMQGEIGFESLEGRGTTFWIAFPAIAVDENRTQAGHVVPIHKPGHLLGLHLEDDTDFHEVFASAVETDIGLVQARTLAEARQLLKDCTFDMVIIDRLISDGDGLSLLDAIPDPDTTKIVVLTAVDDPIQDTRVNDAIVKSRSRPGELPMRLRNLLDEMKTGRTRTSGAA
ncbi:ATP-binding protein [Roseibium aggregatum]|uniref:histidine kinase n=1 Tax=Roseibium aggregatum TaxID=187304 RepID=A0A939EB89_9HYPH|nr:ATP-binding protein [Roseibium aggregatum]MBN9669768.1 PAS domain S-box protein [Roseibium aggregatum]